MPPMGNPVGGARYKSDRMKEREKYTALEQRIIRLEQRVRDLEKNTSPHALAGMLE